MSELALALAGPIELTKTGTVCLEMLVIVVRLAILTSVVGLGLL